MKHRLMHALACAGLVYTSLAGLASGAWAQSCPAYVVSAPKSSALYLYYPTVADPTFPSYGGAPTSPLNPFNIGDLDPTIGTAAQLRNRVEQLVEAGFCEFDINVKSTTATPAPPEARWQIVGIATDDSGSGLIGKAQAVDTNDADPQDYARFWVESLQSWTGAELSGANSTLERWSTGLADLVVHEAGHNYGATHGGGAALPGEDSTLNHFMTNPAMGANPDSIVDALNHFSDTNYEILAHNVGLVAKTLNNWDFVNPNSVNANKLVITVLSNAPSLNIGWWYNGTLSPWQNPTVTDTGAMQSYHGVNYKKYKVTFSSAKAWSGGANGIAPPGVKFHVGASFTQPDPIVIFEATLFDGATELALHPRIFDFDISADFTSFNAFISNPSANISSLILSDIRVFFSPRMVDLETMIDGVKPLGLNGEPVALYTRPRQDSQVNIPPPDALAKKVFEIGKRPVKIPLAAFTDKRHYDITYGPRDCKEKPRAGPEFSAAPAQDDATGFGPPGTADYCPVGNQLSLFPATYVYLMATVTDPKAKQWDPRKGVFFEGPLSNRVFVQFGGVVPDADGNGIDDLLDLRAKRLTDENANGIPDEIERQHKPTDRYPVLVRKTYPSRR